MAAVISTLPSYSEISTDQVFIIKLNGAVSSSWIAQNVYFKISGLGDRLATVALSADETNKIISVLKKDHPYFFKNDDDQSIRPHFVAIKANRTFPRGSKVSLHWNENYDFDVEPEFTAKLTCERETANSGCLPISPIFINFTQSIKSSELSKIYLQNSAGEKIYSEEYKMNSRAPNTKTTYSSVNFKPPFINLSAYVLVLNSVNSERGESLFNAKAFPLKIKTSDYPSLLKIDKAFSVIESEQPILPVTLRYLDKNLRANDFSKNFSLAGTDSILPSQNIKNILKVINQVSYTQSDKPFPSSQFKSTEIKVEPKDTKKTTEVVGVPLQGNGLHLIEFKSQVLGKKFNENIKKNPFYYVRSLSLVTDISLTMKYWPTGALVWVTSLKTGKPLQNIKVSLYSLKGHKIKEASSDLNGIANFKLTDAEFKNLKPDYSRFYAFAEAKGDYSFVSSEDDNGIEPYRFGLNLPMENPKVIYHGIFERNLLRPNEVLNAKLLYRGFSDTGLVIPKISLPATIQINDLISEKSYSTPVKWDLGTGTGVISWKVPEDFNLGTYSVSFPKATEKSFGVFKIEEFKLQALKTSLKPEKDMWVNEKDFSVLFSARYFNGGIPAKMPVKLRYSLSPLNLNLNEDEFESYSWMQEPVKTGLSKNQSDQSDSEDELAPKKSQNKFLQADGQLDQNGVFKFNLKQVKPGNSPKLAVITAEYKDPNGEIQTTSRGFPLYNGDALIGLKSSSWYATAKNLNFSAMLLNLKREPLAEQNITFKLYRVNQFSNRKKLLGGFYTYDNFEEISYLKEICKAKTNTQGIANCKPEDKSLSGEYLVEAIYKNRNGTLMTTNIRSYVYSDEPTWLTGGDSDRMDLLPLKKHFEPNEMVELQVKAPINEGQILITVEREKVLESFVQEFNSKNPTIKLKVKDTWAPNVVISAALIRGRIDSNSKLPVGAIDMAKPSLKLGLTQISVGLSRHKLDVKVKNDKSIYETRSEVSTEVTVLDSRQKPVNGEVAIAVIDEALLALYQNNSWNLLESMFNVRAYQVRTSYLMSAVLGRRTLGLKAVPAGGDGSQLANARELFESSLYWNPKVKVINGKAQVKFKTNDSMTSFKVVAIAFSGADKFGTGTDTFKVKKDIQIYSGLPQAVRTQDKYEARFNVFNATDNASVLTAELTGSSLKLDPQKIKLDPRETKEVLWTVPATTGALTLVVKNGQRIVDSIKINPKVSEVWPERAVSSHFTYGKDQKVKVVSFDQNQSDKLTVSVLSQLSSNNPSLTQFWVNYPFDCFEQVLSKSVALNSVTLFNQLIKKFPLYLDDLGLVKFYPQDKQGSVFLTNHVLQILYYKNWKLKSEHEQLLLSTLRKSFNNVLSQKDFNSEASNLSLRLLTLNTLTLYRSATVDDWSTFKIDLNRLSNNDLLLTLSTLKQLGLSADLQRGLNALQSRQVLAPIGVTLKEPTATVSGWLYSSSSQNLSKALLYSDQLGMSTDEIGKLVLSTLDQNKNTLYQSTVDNVWFALALNHYHHTYEKTPASGDITWELDQKYSDKLTPPSANRTFKVLGQKDFTAQFAGVGTPWWNMLVLTQAPLKENQFRGIEMEKTWTKVEVKNENKKSVGDIWKIKLVVKSNSDFKWLAIRDPIPPGATVIEEANATQTQKRVLEYQILEDWFSNRVKTYEYKIRLNQSGAFKFPSTTAEAMYQPGLNAHVLNMDMIIEK